MNAMQWAGISMIALGALGLGGLIAGLLPAWLLVMPSGWNTPPAIALLAIGAGLYQQGINKQTESSSGSRNPDRDAS